MCVLSILSPPPPLLWSSILSLINILHIYSGSTYTARKPLNVNLRTCVGRRAETETHLNIILSADSSRGSTAIFVFFVRVISITYLVPTKTHTVSLNYCCSSKYSRSTFNNNSRDSEYSDQSLDTLLDNGNWNIKWACLLQYYDMMLSKLGIYYSIILYIVFLIIYFDMYFKGNYYIKKKIEIVAKSSLIDIRYIYNNQRF